MKQQRRTPHFNIHVQGWLLALPAVVLLAAFTHVPAGLTIVDSFYATPRGKRPPAFLGFDQYRHMLDDPIFWLALKNNLIYALITVPLSIALALAMALWIKERIAGRAALRLAFFTPTILPMVAAANIWLFFYTPDYGLLNQFLQGLGLSSVNFLGDPATALPALMAVTVWKEAGFFMIFYLAALQQVPPVLYEAARMENASAWLVFRRITWPLVMPTTLFVAVNALINAFRVVDQVIAMTGGGPNNASTMLLFYIYQVAFSFWDTGYAAALTVVLLAALALVALVQVFALDRRIHYR
ncbi:MULTISPECIES: carbohydrate ABC transporter permease [unclassified Bradyrhizobium]|uniref:carbohydrate ABC transporter permease n=1 Tax=unclassified Bradyrhizobium TaxID=2631580 RepID=UPI0028EE9F08|nr:MULTISPECIES: sugar ABC transporter permease [unclassified Bradyrhizobium]